MSCAKTAEPIEMQFGILSRVGPRNREHALHAVVDVRTARDTFGVSDRLKSMVKHRILGSGKR